MTVSVRLFAIARDLAGRAEHTLELPDGATAGDALAALAAAVPGLERYAGRLALAVNLEYVRPDRVLAAGDEIAVIPPVSGGATTRPAGGAAAGLRPER